MRLERSPATTADRTATPRQLQGDAGWDSLASLALCISARWTSYGLSLTDGRAECKDIY